MRIVLFCHSLISDWNHGNAHFLRGVSTGLLSRGHDVRVYEPESSWSLQNLLAEYGGKPVRDFRRAYPHLQTNLYRPELLDLDRALDGADLVIVHEWNDPTLVKRVGRHRIGQRRWRLLFHDTHHRSITRPEEIAAFELENFDGVLAFGEKVRRVYLERGWADRVWTWHEAADIRVFHPLSSQEKEADLVWIGNWGDEERTAEMTEFLLNPVRSLALKAQIYGVRYPASARALLAASGVEYCGWAPNYLVPALFARHAVTLHIPRRPYVQALTGIPTIRVFEALACGIPLVCSPWEDSEGLFTPGKDFLVARNGREMEECIRAVLHEPGLAEELSRHGRRTVLSRHTCGHRVDELLTICDDIGLKATGHSGLRSSPAWGGKSFPLAT